MSNEKNFIDGPQFKAPHERTPEYVKANGSIKVAELPKIIRSWADTGAAHHGEAWAQGVRFAANQIEDALARQEAGKTAAPVGQEPVVFISPDDLGDLRMAAFNAVRSDYSDRPERYTMPLYAAPPSAPVGQKAVAWRYWSPSGNCWWTRYVAPTEDTSPESTNWEPLYAALRTTVPEAKILPELRLASYHEAIGWNACRDAMLRSAPAAAGVPTMSNVGLRKLTELQAQGYVVNGVSIIDPESSKRGLIDSLGYVGWHTPEQKAAQAVDLDVVRECLGEIADLSVALRQGGPAPEDLDELSDALSEATSKAYDMLQIIDQQAGGEEVVP